MTESSNFNKESPSTVTTETPITRIELTDILHPVEVVCTRKRDRTIILDAHTTTGRLSDDFLQMSTQDGVIRIKGLKPRAGSFAARLRNLLVELKLKEPTEQLMPLIISLPARDSAIDLHVEHCASVTGHIRGNLSAELHDDEIMTVTADGNLSTIRTKNNSKNSDLDGPVLQRIVTTVERFK